MSLSIFCGIGRVCTRVQFCQIRPCFEKWFVSEHFLKHCFYSSFCYSCLLFSAHFYFSVGLKSIVRQKTPGIWRSIPRRSHVHSISRSRFSRWSIWSFFWHGSVSSLTCLSQACFWNVGWSIRFKPVKTGRKCGIFGIILLFICGRRGFHLWDPLFPSIPRFSRAFNVMCPAVYNVTILIRQSSTPDLFPIFLKIF